ncbi:isocitrate lyase/PEP mutase family protein [Peterkaempfera bronchialis]|uniref:isocitrate lyase/PEP mutase family protein n=1 Tax=Peterkaempfera bronchialis TaxID=2126346 RepID=UPI003C2BFACC
MTSSLHDSAVLLRSLHVPGRPLILPNAWDVATARLAEDAGASAIATTSAGAAWALGAADGDRLDRDRALDLVARIAAAVEVPVTADIESGYADEPDGVGETVRGVLAAGAVGINLEDARYDGDAPLRAPAEQAERIAAARAAADAAGVPLYLNARIDTYLRQVGDPATRLRDTLDRAAVYLAAGADGVFVPGTLDPEVLSALVAGVDAPLNVLVGPGAPAVPALAALGVARVSAGSSIAVAAYALAARSARELLTDGTTTSLTGDLGYADLNALLARP